MNSMLPPNVGTSRPVELKPVEVVVPGLAPTAKFTAPMWEEYVSPGHVLAHRLQAFGKKTFPIALVALVAGLGSAWTALSAGGFQLPVQAVQPFLGDPATYTDLGNGVRTDYRAQWLSAYRPTAGLTVAQWQALTDAIQSDVANFGLGNVEAWTATTELEVAPKVTRPGKVFTEHSERLATGIVSLPEDGYSVQLVGFVEGNLAFLNAGFAGCVVAFGPDVQGCQRAIDYSQFSAALDPMKPQPVEPAVQE